jgi:hypothetical protein
MGLACSTYVERGDVYWVLAGTRGAMRALGRLRYRWKNNIKMDLNEDGCGVMDKIWLSIGTGGGHL